MTKKQKNTLEYTIRTITEYDKRVTSTHVILPSKIRDSSLPYVVYSDTIIDKLIEVGEALAKNRKRNIELILRFRTY